LLAKCSHDWGRIRLLAFATRGGPERGPLRIPMATSRMVRSSSQLPVHRETPLKLCFSLERVEVDLNAHGPQENLRKKNGQLMPMWPEIKMPPRPGLVDSRLPPLCRETPLQKRVTFGHRGLQLGGTTCLAPLVEYGPVLLCASFDVSRTIMNCYIVIHVWRKPALDEQCQTSGSP
jgi:hypothetical protein